MSKFDPHCCHYCRLLYDISISGKNDDDYLSFLNYRMILCPTCGNKRCPKASDHNLACTNSNEPGQDGSVYK